MQKGKLLVNKMKTNNNNNKQYTINDGLTA